MRKFSGVDEVLAAVGEDLGASPWHEITQEDVNKFADATGDHQWIHVDPERAKDGPFGGPIAHGFLTLSLTAKFGFEVYSIDNLAMIVNYGCNKVRFPAAVPVGSKVRGHFTIASCEKKPSGYQLITNVTVEAEGIEKPVCIAETVMMLVPKQ